MSKSRKSARYALYSRKTNKQASIPDNHWHAALTQAYTLERNGLGGGLVTLAQNLPDYDAAQCKKRLEYNYVKLASQRARSQLRVDDYQATSGNMWAQLGRRQKTYDHQPRRANAALMSPEVFAKVVWLYEQALTKPLQKNTRKDFIDWFLAELRRPSSDLYRFMSKTIPQFIKRPPTSRWLKDAIKSRIKLLQL